MDWHHAPLHRLTGDGAFCVTAATLHKGMLFGTKRHLDFLVETFFETVKRHNWRPQAWAFFPNHYHFVGTSDEPSSLRKVINEFHSATAREINRSNNTPGRKVWFQYWETHLTIQGSFLARLKYVHENAVHHRIVACAENYRWCSAGWFARSANTAFVKAVRSVKIDRVNIVDVECGGHAAAIDP